MAPKFSSSISVEGHMITRNKSWYADLVRQACIRNDLYALRSMMGENFDGDLYEQGRKDARDLFKKDPEARAEKLEEVKRVLENGEYRHRPGPEYWIGCLCEFDFRW